MALNFFVLIFIVHNLSGNNRHITQLLYTYEITLKVVGTGIKQILYSSYACPSQIYLNGAIQNLNDCHQINITEVGSEIKMIWNGPINSTYKMFYECLYISEVDLTHFDTSLVTNMAYMFYCCHSLTSINLSNLNTKNVINLENMFNHCYILVSLNLENFDTSLLGNMYQLFARSSSLEYINIKNFEEAKNPIISGMFDQLPKNAVICLDSNKSPNIYNLANKLSCATFSCENEWRKVQKTIILASSEYLNDCNLTDYTSEYLRKFNICDSDCKSFCYDENRSVSICIACYENKFLYLGKCIDNCTNGYYEDYYDRSIKVCNCEKIKCKICSMESLNNDLCISCNDGYYPMLNDKSNKGNFINCYNGNMDYYFLDFDTKLYQPCYYSCKTCDKKGNSLNHNCLTCNDEFSYGIKIQEGINCYKLNDNEDVIKLEEETVQNAREEMKNLNNSDLDKGDIIFIQKGSTITISSSDNQKNGKSPNTTNIDMGDCEDKIFNCMF